MQRMSVEVKARVEPKMKQILVELAQREHLDLSDMLRKAIREFIARRSLEHHV